MYELAPTGKKSDDGSDVQTLTTTDTQPLAPATDDLRPAECARDLAQHPAVRDATTLSDCQSPVVEVTLTASTRGVPAGVVRILYRRRFAVVDVTTVARRHLQVTARPRGWSA